MPEDDSNRPRRPSNRTLQQIEHMTIGPRISLANVKADIPEHYWNMFRELLANELRSRFVALRPDTKNFGCAILENGEIRVLDKAHGIAKQDDTMQTGVFLYQPSTEEIYTIFSEAFCAVCYDAREPFTLEDEPAKVTESDILRQITATKGNVVEVEKGEWFTWFEGKKRRQQRERKKQQVAHQEASKTLEALRKKEMDAWSIRQRERFQEWIEQPERPEYLLRRIIPILCAEQADKSTFKGAHAAIIRKEDLTNVPRRGFSILEKAADGSEVPTRIIITADTDDENTVHLKSQRATDQKITGEHTITHNYPPMIIGSIRVHFGKCVTMPHNRPEGPGWNIDGLHITANVHEKNPILLTTVELMRDAIMDWVSSEELPEKPEQNELE